MIAAELLGGSINDGTLDANDLQAQHQQFQ
jgi:hypothetical protein